MHNGTVLLTSDSNGTTVQLTFPINIDIQEQEEIIEKPTTTENKEDTRPLIAIVEDNTSISGFISNLLSTDYRCVTAQNGKNGLKLCINLLPDLIIADVMMPVMDGIEMCRNIRRHMPLATVPIILLTAKNDSGIEYQSAQLGIDAFIAKPFDSSLLVARIKQLLGNKKIGATDAH
ncbi:response regulator [Phocaeicola dorei]|nr:response regulator [Phocaeicola dorei]